MKKLLALLMACATMTCAFASCGEDEADDVSTSSDSSVSESSEEETETTTEEAIEETTEEETTEESTEDTDAEGEWVTDETEFTTHEYLVDADKTPFIGKWQGEKIEFEGETATDVMGIPVSVIYQYELKEDGTLVLGDSLVEISGDTTEYTWGIISDTEIEVVNATMQVAVVMELDGDNLISRADGQTAYLSKVDEFEEFDFEAFMGEFQEGLEDTSIEVDTNGETVDGESDTSVASEEAEEESADDSAETTTIAE